MKNLLSILFIAGVAAFQSDPNLEEYFTVDISTIDYQGKTYVSVTPSVKAGSAIIDYERRFNYLIMNAPEISLPDASKERQGINEMYPDTVAMRKIYFEKYATDENLINYFNQMLAPVTKPGKEPQLSYTTDELMEVASKFFYCDKVFPDSTIQTHICVGLNGVEEAQWEQDYTLLEAFCFEAIFFRMMEDQSSQMMVNFNLLKKESTQQFLGEMTSLDQYLENVKLDVFDKMKNSEVLQQELMSYYDLQKNNLPFRIAD